MRLPRLTIAIAAVAFAVTHGGCDESGPTDPGQAGDGGSAPAFLGYCPVSASVPIDVRSDAIHVDARGVEPEEALRAAWIAVSTAGGDPDDADLLIVTDAAGRVREVTWGEIKEIFGPGGGGG
ncbi:MAG: hypothetical protein R3344_08910 [Acidobacteriota bacterium]|nr:hypothetical protein [Acidobacteriota bacterium]